MTPPPPPPPPRPIPTGREMWSFGVIIMKNEKLALKSCPCLCGMASSKLLETNFLSIAAYAKVRWLPRN